MAGDLVSLRIRIERENLQDKEEAGPVISK